MKGKKAKEISQENSMKLGKYEDCEEECKYGSIWVILTFVFLMISTILLITLVCLCVIRDKQKTSLHNRCNNTGEYLDANRSRRYANKLKFTRTNGSDVFEELSRFEIEAVVNFLHDQKHLNLVDPKNAIVKSNFIHSIEMKLPVKYDVISYLQGEADKPDRMATVYLFMGANEPPTVEEYVVGGIGTEMYAHRIKTDRRKTNIPFEIRPYSTAEFKFIFKIIILKIVKLAKHVLMESYGALPFMCGNQCLKLSMAPISNAFLPEGTRKGWFYFLYDAEFPSVRPLDFLFLVDSTSVNPNEWKIENVWYANQMFSNISIFLTMYNENKINKTRMKFPDEEEKKYGSMEFRTPLMPEEPLRAPRQIEPDGHRFQITDNEIHYMQWKTNFRISTTGGLQLLNVRFNGERIVYEMSMQEVIVMYGGHNPLSRVMNYADGAGLYGTRYRGLLPGVDCPGNAEFVNTYLYASNEMGARVFENGFCVFELNTHSLLRRHRAYGRSGALYGGLEASALVVRAIISVVNYDYVFDFMFYPNGGIETKVSMTGYLGTTFYYPEEKAYGTQVHQNVAAALHNHLFHFKVDLDIKGTENRYETFDVKTRFEENPWYPGKSQHQAIIEKNLKSTEQEALYQYNFDTPKTHVFSNYNETTSLGNARGYRIEIQKMSKQLMPVGEGFENGIPWSRYQMAVTKYKSEEERSSSVFTMWDSKDPVVNFQKYIEDDDNLVDQDLVSWITMGTQHLPHTENLPTSTTIGSQLSFHVLPFNYFDEDPSMHSRDAVRITPLDKKKPLDGAKVEHYGTFDDVDCALNYNLPKNILEKNSTFLFS